VVKRFILIAVLLAGCGKFQDPAIVIDLRTLSMVAQPPEQLVPYTPGKLPDPSMIHLSPVQICGLVADPGAERSLDYVMTACPPQNQDRCDPSVASFMIGGGTIDDPETSPTPQYPCATMDPGADLFNVVEAAAIADPFHGFDSIDIMVEMVVYPQGATPDEAIYAAKGVRFGQTLPAGRTPNQNPTLTEIDVARMDGSKGVLPLGRCIDQMAPLDVAAGETIDLTPLEPPGARETYVVPTFDGGSQTITENLSYDWFAGAGKFSDGSTGGPIDAFGNMPPLDSKWTAPTDPKDVGNGVDLSLYIVQRDERLGEAWYESCVHVHP
jgi:hypothetical protein